MDPIAAQQYYHNNNTQHQQHQNSAGVPKTGAALRNHQIQPPQQQQTGSTSSTSLLQELAQQYSQQQQQQLPSPPQQTLQEQLDQQYLNNSQNLAQENYPAAALLSLDQRHAAGANTADAIIVEESDIATSSDQAVVEFENPYAQGAGAGRVALVVDGASNQSQSYEAGSADNVAVSIGKQQHHHRRRESRTNEIDYLQYQAAVLDDRTGGTYRQRQQLSPARRFLTAGTQEEGRDQEVDDEDIVEGSAGDNYSPSCYRAVIAAASTNLYRSSHGSTYQNPGGLGTGQNGGPNSCFFDADDESEQQHRDSYMRLLQSQNSTKHHPVHNQAAGANKNSKESPERMMSISEEQSTRIHHLKSGSMPELLPSTTRTLKNNNGAAVNSNTMTEDEDTGQVVSGFEHSSKIARNAPKEARQPAATEDMQDSLQQREEGEDKTQSNSKVSSASKGDVGPSGAASRKAQQQLQQYQDSLESLTPRSQRTPPPVCCQRVSEAANSDQLKKIIQSAAANLTSTAVNQDKNNTKSEMIIEKQTSGMLGGGRKDQYDPTNVSHKQYFMPQAYPPVSKKTSASQLPLKNNNPADDGENRSKSPQKTLAPKAKTQVSTPRQEQELGAPVSSKMAAKQKNLDTSGGQSDQSPSFRLIQQQQTFKPLELQNYLPTKEARQATPDLMDLSTYSKGRGLFCGNGGDTNTQQSQFSAGGGPTPNTKSVQELHCRNDELQTRIGNLEQILMARLAETRANDPSEGGIHEDETSRLQAYGMVSSTSRGGRDQHQPKSHNNNHQPQLTSSHNRSLSHSSYPVSYVHTEEPLQQHPGSKIQQPKQDVKAENEDHEGEDKSVPATSSHDHRFNEEPLMHGLSSKDFINSSRQALISHRSAADLVKMHHLQFQSHHLHSSVDEHQDRHQTTQDVVASSTRTGQAKLKNYGPQPQRVHRPSSIYGCSTAQYVMTTEDAHTTQNGFGGARGSYEHAPSSSHLNSYITTIRSKAEIEGSNNIQHEQQNAQQQHNSNMFADTDAEDLEEQVQGEGSSLMQQKPQQVDETMPGRGASPRLHYEQQQQQDQTSTEQSQVQLWQQRQEQKNSLLRFLECQNAETLKAIQHENSTYTQQQNANKSHNKILSESMLDQNQRDNTNFRPGVPRALVARSLAAAAAQAASYEDEDEHQAAQPPSEFQTTTIHEVNNDSLADAPQFIDIDSRIHTRVYEEYSVEGQAAMFLQHDQLSQHDQESRSHHQEDAEISATQDLQALQPCSRCQHVYDLNEALSEENERLRDHMESIILMVQQFEIERNRLTQINSTKIDGLEQQVESLQKERDTVQKNEARDQEETIRCLKVHIKNLERTNFQNELQSVSVASCNLSQSALNGAKVMNAPAQMTQKNVQSQGDRDWKNRVSVLEQELRETKDYYLKRIDVLEKGPPPDANGNGGNTTSAGGHDFSDTTLIVAGVGDSSLVGAGGLNQGHSHLNKNRERRIDNNVTSKEDTIHLLTTTNQEADELQRSQADRNRLYEKLALAEQVLEQITEELQVLAAENKFLSKLNQRLTYHACRQEKYFMDFRRSYCGGGRHSSYSTRLKNHESQRSSFCASQSAISTKEVVIEKEAVPSKPLPTAGAAADLLPYQNISKERVNQLVNEAESMLRSERKPRPYEEQQMQPPSTDYHQNDRRRPSGVHPTNVTNAPPNHRSTAYQSVPTLSNQNQTQNHSGIVNRHQPQTTLQPRQLGSSMNPTNIPIPAHKLIAQKQGMQECLEVLEIVRVFIRQNPVQFADQIQLQQAREKSSYLKCDQFEKVITNMQAPISRVEIRRLFHFIFTGMQDPTEPTPQSQSPNRYLSIADLCKIIDQSAASSATNLTSQDDQEDSSALQFTQPSHQKADNATLANRKGAERHHTDSILRAEDLLKRQTATIESSEVKTFGGGCDQSRGLLADSLASINLKMDQNAKNCHQTSAFYDQERINTANGRIGGLLSMSSALQTNSIIQLEDQLRQQELFQEALRKNKQKRVPEDRAVKDVAANAGRQEVKQRDQNRRQRNKEEVDQSNDHGQAPTTNKVEQLKQRIERLSRQAKKTVNETKNTAAVKQQQQINSRTQQAQQMPLDLLNRSTSEDRATQTIQNSTNNQYKRGIRANSKETPSSGQQILAQAATSSANHNMLTIQH